MTSVSVRHEVDRERPSSTAQPDAPPATPESVRLTREQCNYVRFVLDVVGFLAARHGFDPAELANARTGASFGPLVARMRKALKCSEAGPVDGQARHAVNEGSRMPTAPPPT